MLSEFFLNYANYSLRENPQNLYKILPPDILKGKGLGKRLSYLIEKIVFFSECKTINEARKKYEQLWAKTRKKLGKYCDNHERLVREIKDKYRKKYGQLWAKQHEKKISEEFKEMFDKERAKEEYGDPFFIGCAYHSVYGFSESPYWNPSKPCFEENTSPKAWFPACNWKYKLRRKYIDRNLVIGGPERLRCHECDQILFINILKQIVEGKKYSQIDGLGYIIDCSDCVREGIKLSKDSKEECFKKSVFIVFPSDLIPTPASIDDYHRFGHLTNLIFGIAGKSLFVFLSENDRRKLHLCDNCGNFYISQSIRKQRFCSDKCRLKWHNRKRIESGEHAKYKRDRKYNEKVIKEKGEAPESYFG